MAKALLFGEGEATLDEWGGAKGAPQCHSCAELVPGGVGFSGQSLAAQLLEVHGGDGTDDANFDYRCGTASDGATFDSVEQLQAKGAYAFNPATLQVAADATSAELNGATACTGGWSAVSEANWIALNAAGGTDAASFTLALVLQANPSSDPRTGYVTVDGFKVAVVQAGLPGAPPAPEATPTPVPTPTPAPDPDPTQNTVLAADENSNVSDTLQPESDPPTTEERRTGCNTSPASLLSVLGLMVAAALRRRVRQGSIPPQAASERTSGAGHSRRPRPVGLPRGPARLLRE